MAKYYPVGDTAFRYRKVGRGVYNVVVVVKLHPFSENVAGLVTRNGWKSSWWAYCRGCEGKILHSTWWKRRVSAAEALCMHYIKEHLDGREGQDQS